MAAPLRIALPTALLVVAVLAARDGAALWQPKGLSQRLVGFPAIADKIVKNTGYRIDDTDVSGNRTHMQMSIYDSTLETADEAARERPPLS